MATLKSVKAEGAYDVDELVVTLRDSQLPSLLVENHSDVRIYSRWVSMRLFGSYSVDVRAVGGREKLLQIYERSNEFSHVPVAFVANRGMWLFTRIPREYQDIIWTKGYSLANDLYLDAQSVLERLLDSHEVVEHQQVLYSVCKWYAFVVEEHLKGNQRKIAHRLQEIVPFGQTDLDKDFCIRNEFYLPDVKFIEKIKNNYQLLLPGNMLFEILIRFLNSPNRGFKFNINSDGLYHIALTIPETHPKMDRLMQEVKKKLNNGVGQGNFHGTLKDLSDNEYHKPVNTIE